MTQNEACPAESWKKPFKKTNQAVYVACLNIFHNLNSDSKVIAMIRVKSSWERRLKNKNKHVMLRIKIMNLCFVLWSFQKVMEHGQIWKYEQALGKYWLKYEPAISTSNNMASKSNLLFFMKITIFFSKISLYLNLPFWEVLNKQWKYNKQNVCN